MRYNLRYMLGLLALVLLAPQASSQELYGPRVSPYAHFNYGASHNLSPYLNLIRNRGGINNPAVNYYLGVLPERDRRVMERELDRTYNTLQADIYQRNTLDDPLNLGPLFRQLPRTGHPTAFGQYGTYFNIPSAAYTGQRR